MNPRQPICPCCKERDKVPGGKRCAPCESAKARDYYRRRHVLRQAGLVQPAQGRISPVPLTLREQLALHARQLGIIAALLALLCSSADAAGTRDVRLRWEAPLASADAPVTGYALYRTPSGGSEERIEVGAGTEATLSFLRDRSYRLELVAYNDAGESERSNALRLDALPGAPRRFEIVIPADGPATIRELP